MFFSGIADEAGKPLETQIRAHQDLGWKHIEVRSVDDTTLADADDETFERIHARLQEAGMQVSCFAGAVANWAREVSEPDDKDIAELRSSIPRMRKMGAPFIRIMSYANKNGVDEAQWRATAIERIRTFAKMAEDGGVTLVHENCTGWGGLSPRNTLEMLSQVNSPALKLVFDIGNATGHGIDAWEYYQAVREHIVYVHIKDIDRTAGRTTWPGEGDAQIPRIVADLLATGYDGGFSIEPHLKAQAHLGTESDPQEMYDTYVEYGRRFMKLMDDVRAS